MLKQKNIWGITKNRHYLRGRQFTLITDLAALIWLMSYTGHNHVVRRLQLEMHGYNFTIVHPPERMLEDANYFSRVGEDGIVDPLRASYKDIAKFLHEQHSPENHPEEISQENMPGRKSKRKKVTHAKQIIHQST